MFIIVGYSPTSGELNEYRRSDANYTELSSVDKFTTKLRLVKQNVAKSVDCFYVAHEILGHIQNQNMI